MPHGPVAADRRDALQKNPPGQGNGAPRLVCGHIEPNGHGIGAVENAGQYEPIGQTIVVVESAQYEPAGQANAADILAAQYFAAGHGCLSEPSPTQKYPAGKVEPDGQKIDGAQVPTPVADPEPDGQA